MDNLITTLAATIKNARSTDAMTESEELEQLAYIEWLGSFDLRR